MPIEVRSSSLKTLPIKKRAVHRKRTVTFSRASCRWFKKDLTEEEKRKVWYNAEEYRKIQTNIHTELRSVVALHRQMMKCPDTPPPREELNVRGLEHHLLGPSNVKRQRRRRFVQYVIHTNKYMRSRDPQELGAYVTSLTREDQRRAQRMADYDAYEAYQVHRESGSFMEDEFQEFDNVPKARIGGRGRSERTIAAPLA
jgi:hypothetical protein